MLTPRTQDFFIAGFSCALLFACQPVAQQTPAEENTAVSSAPEVSAPETHAPESSSSLWTVTVSFPPAQSYGTEIKTMDEEPVTFTMPDAPVQTFKQEFTVKDSLPSEADKDCYPPHPAGYFDQLQKKFTGAKGIVYVMAGRTPQSSGDSTYSITLIPNSMNYKTVEDVNNDFSYHCGLGALSPLMLNKEWLIFTIGCGGVDAGCGLMQEIVESSIRLR
ncbi:hypothetical protein HZA87_03675 [Candidatus Uhrbacteria bacterium]|nr:hypothetical protein [Candidatus Uhrbacteria bacterium]